MIVEQQKAQLVVEVLEKFAPYMDDATALYTKMGAMITHFGQLVESFSELPEHNKIELMQFIKLFNNYIEHASSNHADLHKFYSYMASTTNGIIADYKHAIGME